ncbi:uncharacterized protein ARMOST_16724 [Armillaria ostoyae]|uniref:Uncharacterized protein n=1 Tax=Armillaria ostoyae TaxID=47428 RepID=A0A284RWZ9_ARMOS|nr:uncharacterized protein ARMOST_16724 [Armillaria ostoyae]
MASACQKAHNRQSETNGQKTTSWLFQKMYVPPLKERRENLRTDDDEILPVEAALMRECPEDLNGLLPPPPLLPGGQSRPVGVLSLEETFKVFDNIAAIMQPWIKTLGKACFTNVTLFIAGPHLGQGGQIDGMLHYGKNCDPKLKIWPAAGGGQVHAQAMDMFVNFAKTCFTKEDMKRCAFPQSVILQISVLPVMGDDEREIEPGEELGEVEEPVEKPPKKLGKRKKGSKKKASAEPKDADARPAKKQVKKLKEVNADGPSSKEKEDKAWRLINKPPREIQALSDNGISAVLKDSNVEKQLPPPPGEWLSNIDPALQQHLVHFALLSQVGPLPRHLYDSLARGGLNDLDLLIDFEEGPATNVDKSPSSPPNYLDLSATNPDMIPPPIPLPSDLEQVPLNQPLDALVALPFLLLASDAALLEHMTWEPWFLVLMVYFKGYELGDRWKDTLGCWSVWEGCTRFVDLKGAKFSLPPRGCPEEIGWTWWQGMQPEWCGVQDGGGMMGSEYHGDIKGDWEKVEKHGQNGFASPLAGLAWWGATVMTSDAAEKDALLSKWANMVEECHFVLVALLAKQPIAL